MLSMSEVCQDMYKYTIARQLATKRVITNRGDEVGKLTDMLVDPSSGNIEALVVEVDRDSKLIKRIGTGDRIINIPYSAVTAVSDVFIVDEREVGQDQS
ncbi:MAG: PRC-barrel domain-containing protein [Candidatus Diapherotrites archaeon]|nr:PRC-barrel domain-containing protein [Candidatus Diapherotrites archaeon]